MAFWQQLHLPELHFGDFLVPWGMVIGALGFLVAWGVVAYGVAIKVFRWE